MFQEYVTVTLFSFNIKLISFSWNRCKRLNRVGLRPTVLSQAGPKALAVKAKNWSDSAHRFLKRCVFAGNLEACYTLGMVRSHSYLLES